MFTIKTQSQKRQYELLKHTIEIAYEKSKFYREHFKKYGLVPDDFKKLEDFKKFPFTTKEDLLNFNNDFLTKPKSKMLRVFSSSGTTSKGKFIFLDGKDLDNYLIPVQRANKLAGIIPGKDIVGIIFNLGITVAGIVFGVLGYQKSEILAVPLGFGLDPEILINYFKQMEVSVIHTATPQIFSLTEKLIKLGFDLKSLKIKKIFLGGALLTKEMRKFIENEWGAEIFDAYSSTEGSRIALECNCHNGFHLLAPDYLYLEILDEITGEPVREGELGEVAITTLKRECMPLIKYKMNDLAKITNKPCFCGIKTPRILPPIGRSEERIVFKNFYKFYGHQINEILLEFGEKSPAWQLVITDINSKEKIDLFVETDKSKIFEKTIEKNLCNASESMNRAIASKTVLPPTVKFITKNSLERNVYGKIKNKIIDNRQYKFF